MVLPSYLEQVFRQDDMMELYLNIVAFGPDVYGITQAAEYYFGRKPEELHVGECFFLASLLPSPLRYGKLREKGAVEGTWLRHLQALGVTPGTAIEFVTQEPFEGPLVLRVGGKRVRLTAQAAKDVYVDAVAGDDDG